MKKKAFTLITTVSLVLTLTVTITGLIGITITGIYPGIIVLTLITLIPITSKLYDKKISTRPSDFKRNYSTTLTIINLIAILVVLWMTFVIVHDRVS